MFSSPGIELEGRALTKHLLDVRVIGAVSRHTNHHCLEHDILQVPIPEKLSSFHHHQHSQQSIHTLDLKNIRLDVCIWSTHAPLTQCQGLDLKAILISYPVA